ncbi:MAG: hypothetical protein JSS49_03065 [Planctomycetes bacterium]|nr:hypothetical protein [Planctomycetota bacterium]
MSPIDLLADLPPPHDDEPPSLRDDIADELGDHLHCAVNRELLTGHDKTTAEQRVLDRFGDPSQLARRLWWQAMWSRIMGQRILSGLQWVVSLTAAVFAGAVFWQQSQILTEMRTARQEDASQREQLTVALNHLRVQTDGQGPVPSNPSDFATPGSSVRPNPPIAPDSMEPVFNGVPPFDPDPISPETGGPPNLTVKFVQGRADGPVVNPQQASLRDSNGTSIEHASNLRRVPHPATVRHPDGSTEESIVMEDVKDQISFRSLQPGRYEFHVTLTDGQNCRRPVLIRDEKPQELTIICPGPRETATVLVTLPPLPADLQEWASRVDCMLEEQPVVVEGIAWESPSQNPPGSTPVPVYDHPDDLMPSFAPDSSRKRTTHDLLVDPRTGRPISLWTSKGIPSPAIDLRDTKPEDCVMFVKTGPVSVRFLISLEVPTEEGDGAYVSDAQSSPQPSVQKLIKTVERGENRWEFAWPEEFLDNARQSLKRLKTVDAVRQQVPGVPLENELQDPNQKRVPVPTADEQATSKAADPPTLTLNFIQEKSDGPPADVGAITFLNSQGKSRHNRFWKVEPSNGRWISREKWDPDRYELNAWLPDRQQHQQYITIRDEQPREITIVCPPLRKRIPVLISAPPLPEDLVRAGCEVSVNLVPGPVQTADGEWTLPDEEQRVSFDPQTGKATLLYDGRNQVNLKSTPAEDRTVFLPNGPISIRYRVDVDTWLTSISWPDASALVVNLKQDQKTWNVEFPKELIAEIRKRLQEDESLAAGKPAQTRNSPEVMPMENKVPPTLTVKCVQETADGPPAQVANVYIAYGNGSTEVADSAGPRDKRRFCFQSLSPDRYELTVTANDQVCTQSILIRDEKPREITVICPGPRKKVPVLITMPPLPEDLRTAKIVIKCRFDSGETVLDGKHWWPGSSNSQELTFDPNTGQATLIQNGNGQSFDLKDASADDRSVFLLAGRLKYRFEAKLQRVESGVASIVESVWPKENGDWLSHTVTTDEKSWKLELPKETVRELRKAIDSNVVDNPAEKPAQPDPNDKPADSKNASDAAPLGDR